MTKITGEEPWHWHNAEGRHNMTDPRTLPNYPRKFWDKDELAYVSHLNAHKDALGLPERQDDDPEVIRTLFTLIEANEQQNDKLRALISAFRMER